MRKKSTKILIMSLVLSTLGISTTQLVANAGTSSIGWGILIDKKVVELEQVITPLESGGDQLYYWATNWRFEGRFNGGYMGVQTAGSRWDTQTKGPIANFSIWGATSASPGPNAVCRKFDWEGTGIQCRLDLNTVMTGNKMTVKRSEDGLSWTAQIEQTNELPKIIATISIEAKFSITGVSNFQEYYGQNHSTLCGELPGAAAKFRFPKYVFEDGTATQGTLASFSKLPCISVDQIQFNPGLEVFMRQGKSQTPIPETNFELKEAAEAKAKAEAEERTKARAEVLAKSSMKKEKFSLFCIKGSTVLRVIGNIPKCSSGFKKNKNLLGVNLKNVNLSGVNLSGVNLSGVTLSGINLSGANLTFANLTNVNLSWANLFSVNLSGANLSGANLSGANLSGAYLSGANLSGANLIGANLIGANLSDVNLSGANLPSVNLSGANLSYININLSGANLSGAYLTGANLSGANLSGAKLLEASMNNADMSYINLSGANLSGAKLSPVNLTGANLTGANLTGANLTGANLTFANLTSANLSRVNILSYIILSYAIMPDGTIHG